MSEMSKAKPSGPEALRRSGKQQVAFFVDAETLARIDQASAMEGRARSAFLAIYGLPGILAAADRIHRKAIQKKLRKKPKLNPGDRS